MHHIYLTRHGARADWDPLYTLAHSPTTLLHDPPLSHLGMQQSLELKSYFLSLPSHLRPAHIFSSPYYRCLQTIQPTAEALGIKVKIEQGVSEWHSSPAIVEENGIRRVKRKKHASFKKLQELFSRDVFIDWSYESLVKLNVESDVDNDIEIVAEDLKMETKEQLYQRVGLTLQKMVEEGYTKDGPILIVSHAATLIMMGKSLQNNPNAAINCGVATLSYYTNPLPSLQLKLQSNSDCNGFAERFWTSPWNDELNGSYSHLSEGELHNWQFPTE